MQIDIVLTCVNTCHVSPRPGGALCAHRSSAAAADAGEAEAEAHPGP